MGKLDLKTLVNSKIEVIKAEMGALLFNLGKTHRYIKNWRNSSELKNFNKNDPEYKKVSDDFKKEFGYALFDDYREYFKQQGGKIVPFEMDLTSISNDLKDFLFNTKLDLDHIGRDLKLYHIIYAATGNTGKEIADKIFFQGCENINSGLDKGSPEKKKQLTKLWISNAFGSCKELVIKDSFDHARIDFFRKLNNKISTFKELGSDEWKELREFVFQEIKEWYSHLLSDSRFPVNDVTLWDQVYMTASLFKASLAAMLLDKKQIKVYSTPHKIRWSILGIQYDKTHLIEKSSKSQMISWYRKHINECDEALKKLIEEKYALGNEIYRDETGIYFIVPENLAVHEDTLSDKEFYRVSDELAEIKSGILKAFKEHFSYEIFPSILLTKPSRGIMSLSLLIERAKENFLRPELPEDFDLYHLLEKEKSIETPERYGLCQVCGIRMGKRMDDFILCKECAKKKEGKINEWRKSLDKETIWTGDIQDKNRRIALVSLKFELKPWLNGDFMNTTVIRDIKWAEKLEEMKKTLYAIREIKRIKGDDYEHYLDLSANKDALILFIKEVNTLLKGVSKKLKLNISNKNEVANIIMGNEKFEKENQEFKKTIKIFHFMIFTELAKEAYNGCRDRGETIDIFIFQILFEPSLGDRWEKYIIQKLGSEEIIDFKNRTINWEELTDKNLAFLSRLLLQFMIRKNPSPARVRRVTETTKAFFEKVKKNLVSYMLPENEKKKEDDQEDELTSDRGWRDKRLVWTVENAKKGEYACNGLDFIADGSGQVYLISSIGQAMDIIAQGKPAGKGKTGGKKWIEEKIKNNSVEWLKEKIQITDYENESNSLELKRENAKYLSYLPFISITDPTPASWQFIVPAEYVPQIIKAVQQQYNEEFKYVTGKLPLHIGVVVQDYKKPLYIGLQALRKIKRDIHSLEDIKMKVSVKEFKREVEIDEKRLNQYEKEEGVGNLRNAYSLYEARTESEQGYLFNITPDSNGKRRVVPIFKEDQKENQYDDLDIYIYPNTIDFEFLDVNTRRNDIAYNGGKRVKPKSNRPYTWQEWKQFDRFYKYFAKKNSKSVLQHIVHLCISKLQDWEKEEEGLEIFMLSVFKNVLGLKEEKELNEFANIFGMQWREFENLKPDHFVQELERFIDMYEFWHKALKKL